MRERAYLIVFLLIAGFLIYLGHDQIRQSILLSWGLTFGGTTTAAVLALVLYRFRLALRESRHELARKEAELDFALKVQRALLPRYLPAAGGLEFSAICIPAAGISGDYYDVLYLPDGRIVLAIADISGKGISAAILMANLQAFLRVVAMGGAGPREVCGKINQHLHQVSDASRFATLFYGEWHPAEKALKFVNAGHNSPLLIGRGRELVLERGGIPLGIMPEYDYEMGEVLLQEEDLLVLYSDGITEAGVRAGEEFGEKRLYKLVESANGKQLADIQAEIVQAVRGWAGEEIEDDMTLVLVRASKIGTGAG